MVEYLLHLLEMAINFQKLEKISMLEFNVRFARLLSGDVTISQIQDEYVLDIDLKANIVKIT